MKPKIILAAFSGAVVAQEAEIGAPPRGAKIIAGQKFTVQVQRPVRLVFMVQYLGFN